MGNLGQLLGQQKLRIMQLEDELAETLASAMPRTESRVGMVGGMPKRVINLLAQAEEPLSSLEIAKRLGCDVHYLYQKIPELLRAGRVGRVGRRKHYLYFARPAARERTPR